MNEGPDSLWPLLAYAVLALIAASVSSIAWIWVLFA